MAISTRLSKISTALGIVTVVALVGLLASLAGADHRLQSLRQDERNPLAAASQTLSVALGDGGLMAMEAQGGKRAQDARKGAIERLGTALNEWREVGGEPILSERIDAWLRELEGAPLSSRADRQALLQEWDLISRELDRQTLAAKAALIDRRGSELSLFLHIAMVTGTVVAALAIVQSLFIGSCVLAPLRGFVTGLGAANDERGTFLETLACRRSEFGALARACRALIGDNSMHEDLSVIRGELETFASDMDGRHRSLTQALAELRITVENQDTVRDQSQQLVKLAGKLDRLEQISDQMVQLDRMGDQIGRLDQRSRDQSETIKALASREQPNHDPLVEMIGQRLAGVEKAMTALASTMESFSRAQKEALGSGRAGSVDPVAAEATSSKQPEASAHPARRRTSDADSQLQVIERMLVRLGGEISGPEPQSTADRLRAVEKALGQLQARKKAAKTAKSAA
ncbi:MAG: hypothetical protein ACFB6S_05685 [Geminicoccaceae bacterium]